ncbi:purine or other phosphorylase family 1 [Paenibacillus mucilaginosus KNP414]|uniref:Futalosine hydrolase n=1 Tax=Paenibacillus mucilaginosus (strain KNP414) TaxID=1036673 RepID=F8FIX2_PAEMK|nr:purine or other phosphorylase family 1 [Paenibacillus mucilaginosus KNP414]
MCLSSPPSTPSGRPCSAVSAAPLASRSSPQAWARPPLPPAIVAADLGAETPEGFRSVDELGFGSSRLAVDSARTARFAEALAAAGLPGASGPVLTVSTVTGSSATAEALAARVPGAAAEAMEGFGVATAAAQYGLPVMEVRAISNAVGPRDRAAWRIPEALKALEAASTLFLEVL